MRDLEYLDPLSSPGLKAPKARNVIAWGSAPGGISRTNSLLCACLVFLDPRPNKFLHQRRGQRLARGKSDRPLGGFVRPEFILVCLDWRRAGKEAAMVLKRGIGHQHASV